MLELSYFKLGLVIPDTAMYNLILTKIDIFTLDINLWSFFLKWLFSIIKWFEQNISKPKYVSNKSNVCPEIISYVQFLYIC